MFFLQRFQLTAILPNFKILTFYFCKCTSCNYSKVNLAFLYPFSLLLLAFAFFFCFFLVFFGFFLVLLFALRFLLLVPYKTDLDLVFIFTFIILCATMPLFNVNLRKRKGLWTVIMLENMGENSDHNNNAQTVHLYN